MQQQEDAGPPVDDDGLPAASLRRLIVVGVTGVVLVAVGLCAIAIRSRHDVSETTGTKNVPLAISCPVVGYCMVVDAHGNAISFQHGHWSSPLAVDSSELEDVSCASPTFCI